MELMIKTSKCVVLGVICFVSRLEVLEGLKCHTPPVEVTFRESVRFIFIVVSSFTIRVNFAAGLKYILPNGRFAASIRTPFWLLDPCRPFVHGFSIRPSTLIVWRLGGRRWEDALGSFAKYPLPRDAMVRVEVCDFLREFSEVQQWQTTNSSTCVRSDVFLRWSHQMLRRWALQSRGRWWAWELRTKKRRVTLASRFFMVKCLWVKAGEGCETCKIG